MKRSRVARGFELALALGLLAGALWILRTELAAVTWQEIRSDLAVIPPGTLTIAALLTALNYALLPGYDWLAMRYAHSVQPYRRVALASTLGRALSQALGAPVLTGAPLRVRLYGAWGVEGVVLARILAFTSLTFWLGFVAVGGGLLAFAPPASESVAPGALRAIGGLLLLASGAYGLWVGRGSPPLRVGSAEIVPPAPRLAIGQLAVAAADWAVGATVLYALFPSKGAVPALTFMAAFVAAHAVGVVSRVPGGLGVFEAAFVALMPRGVSGSALFASLVAYRAVYYLGPMLLAGIGLAAVEGVRRRRHAQRALSAIGSVLPTALSAGVFGLGATLLLLGSVPVPSGRLEWLAAWVRPLALNLSHFAASLVGAGLIVLARGLQRRLRGAFQMSLIGLLAMTLVSLTTFGAPLVSATSLGAAVALWAARDRFYRASSFFDQTMDARWMLAIGTTLAAVAWLGLFTFRSVEYTNTLWWRFTIDADAPRFLRASVGVASVMLLVAIARLLRPAPTMSEATSEATLDGISGIVRASPRANAHLALLGDKSILMSDSGRSFVMYRVRGSSWIALGDPLGDESEIETLLWRFRESADRAGDSVVFYQVAPRFLHHYVDMGMSLFKVGESGRVPLSDLTLEGKRWGDMRQALRRFEGLAGEFAIVPPDEVGGHLTELRSISDAWLESRNTREKGFSLGYFDEAYLTRTPVAVARVDDRVVAFANLFAGDSREEMSIDLMRYSGDAPKGTMDFMFANLLAWGRDQGYRYFSLGMAPLAGLEDHRLAPMWHRFGDVLFDYGEPLYNFQGLHGFKEKFGPEWESRYLAVESPRHLPGALADLTSLIAGGFKAVFGR